jgi:hypothetical protein
MLWPIKLNRTGWPRALAFLLPSATDPRGLTDENIDPLEFTRAVSALKFGGTFKTTGAGRHRLTDDFLANSYSGANPVILDIGASDGSTSLDLMQRIAFARYYVTDLYTEVFYGRYRGRIFFFDENGTCILSASKRFVIYNDCDDASMVSRLLVKIALRNAQRCSDDPLSISLFNPALRKYGARVRLVKHDILGSWKGEQVDLVVIGNLLNEVYFFDHQIADAVAKAACCCKPLGRIAIIDNRPDERATVFVVRDGRLKVEIRINGGAQAERIALSVDASLRTKPCATT